MSDFAEARRAVIARVLDGDGTASQALRRAAFDNAGLPTLLGTLIAKVAKHAHEVTDDDVAAPLASGFSADQLFELVICAAIGQATRQNDSALAALDSATGKE